ncbi:SagB family peptide dehydrogenase [Brevibacillus agri]|uniref:SagB family peptide dehydrogenase n=1 Tax=Brevibacillus agri TaxID=51101 RepID=UPI00287042D8|nr:SagB family peptide dehydrogenase [Brevibacillus agri]MDR9507495.1 SagB family peptide dehydrogenase [Brevibacillus agri]
MSLERFVHDLHFATEKVRPPDLEVNWDDAPLPYKLYSGLPAVSLPAEVALSLAEEKVEGEPSLAQLGSLLYYMYGLAKVSQTVFPQEAAEEGLFPVQSYRRAIPSGGALYPNEVYLYGKLSYMAQGVYHYDVAHHRLVLLREGDFDAYVSQSLGQRCALHHCFGALFVSAYFWKNAFKYDLFSYRLQGLDTGVLLGQWLALAEGCGIETGVHYLFLDRAINHLLGLSGNEESVYAIMPLAAKRQEAWPLPAAPGLSAGAKSRGETTAEQLLRQLEPVTHRYHIGSQRQKDYPLLRKMNEAAMYESTASFGTPRAAAEQPVADSAKKRHVLPDSLPQRYDFAEFCRRRTSPELDFVWRKIAQVQLSALLQEAFGAFRYRHDLGGTDSGLPALCVCIHQVDGIENGAYRYEPDSHSLLARRYGDQRLELQAGMTLDNVNLFQVPLCFHVAGERNQLRDRWGDRGYRILQMQAGIAVHRLLLGAFSCGLGGHPLLGYDVAKSDGIYGLADEQKTCLIQLPVGSYRPRVRLEGSLHG